MQNKLSAPSRNIGADILRCLAFFSVVSVHFFYNNGYYDTTVAGEKMLLMTLMRSFFIICVPLFMILSGYLMRQKKPEWRYYKKLGNTYLVYVLSALCCIGYKVLVLKQSVGVRFALLGILDFSAAPYAWYVEMYVGLFLLAPFFNILYNHIPTQKLKLLLLGILLFTTALPALTNVYAWTEGLGWWANPSGYRTYNALLPDWWTGMYPVTYYFIGCYLNEYGLKIKKGINLLLILGVWLLSGLYTFWRSHGTTFIWGTWCDYSSLFNVVLTTLVFAFILNRNYTRCPGLLARGLQKISGLCFGGYLLSWILDTALYPILKQNVPHTPDRIWYYFLIVPLSFAGSLVLSYLINKLANALQRLWAALKLKKA